MFDWPRLIAHASWILGAALLLALTGRLLYERQPVGGPSLWTRLSAAPLGWLALVLLGAGLAGTGRSGIEMVFWILFTLLCAFLGLRLLRERSGPARSNNVNGN